MQRMNSQRRYVSKSRLQTSQTVGQRGKDAYSSASRSTYRTRAHYGYTPSMTTMTTPRQDSLGGPRPQSYYTATPPGRSWHTWLVTSVGYARALHAPRGC